MANSFTMVEESTFDALIKSVEDIKAMLAAQTCFSGYDASKIYANSMMKSILGVGDKTLKKLRDNNLLPYHQTGKEYWYTQADLDYLMEVTKEYGAKILGFRVKLKCD